jgi:hypothetical protein
MMNREMNMETQLRNRLKKLALAAAALACMHCGANPNVAAPDDKAIDKGLEQGNGVVKSTILLGKVGALRKEATISLKKLYVMAVSSATPADTVLDSAMVSGYEATTVTRTLSLKPLRNWTVSAFSVDQKDSVIHSGASSPFFVKPADTAAVSLNLTSRFAMYQANFNTLPDSVFSTQAGTGKDKLNLNRLVLKIDGQVRADSVLAGGYFGGGQNVNLYFDYITPGQHTVTLEAYGTMHTYAGVLYSGSSAFTVAAGVDETKAVALNWVGPTSGTGKLTVILGKVGRVIVNGGISGAIL